MILSRRHLAALAVGAVTVAASCSTGDASGRDVGQAGVVATTSIWADITSKVLCGEDVVALIPAGADPHTFEPSLRDREVIEDADLIVTNGSDLEGGLLDLIETAPRDDAVVVEITSHVDVITTADDPHDDGHGHGLGVDPHVWQDPSRIAGALPVIASAGTATGRGDCSGTYAADLMELDAEITELLAGVPTTQRIMVTGHDSLAYFADRYGIEIVGTVIPSTNTLAQTNAADLAVLADVIDARGVRAIFTEKLSSTADADALAERLGVAVVPLITDALTDDPETDTYVEMMRSNATRIAGALEP